MDESNSGTEIKWHQSWTSAKAGILVSADAKHLMLRKARELILKTN